MVILMLLSLVLSALSVPVRPRRDFAGMKRRRKQAARLFRRGVRQADVARQLGVSRQSVSRWYAEWSAGGSGALDGAGRAGRLPRLTKLDLARIDRALRRGARAHGYPTELWTRVRVAQVIQSLTGVAYHPSHVSRLLRQLGWSRQRPARRAVERNEAAITAWVKERWPRVKKTPAAGGPGSASKTSRGSRSSPR